MLKIYCFYKFRPVFLQFSTFLESAEMALVEFCECLVANNAKLVELETAEPGQLCGERGIAAG